MTTAYSDRQLLGLLTGLLTPQNPPATTSSGEDYYLEEGSPRTLRLNWPSLIGNTVEAWRGVKHRDWLVGQLISSRGQHTPFVAIPSPPALSQDLITSKITWQDAVRSQSKLLKEATLFSEPGTNFRRAYHAAISLGVEPARQGDANLTVLGGGIRRSLQVYELGAESEALQFDFEFYIPIRAIDMAGNFVEIPGEGQRMRMGFSLIRRDGWLSGEEEALSIAGLRLAVDALLARDPQTRTGEPTIRVHTQHLAGQDQEWVDVGEDVWRATAESLLSAQYVRGRNELLTAPFGALMKEKEPSPKPVGDPEKLLATERLEAAESAAYLRSVWKTGKLPDKGSDGEKKKNERKVETWPTAGPTVADLFVRLGLIQEGKDDQETYRLIAPEQLEGLDYWEAFNGLIDSLDGLVLYEKALSRIEEKEDAGSDAGNGQEEEDAAGVVSDDDEDTGNNGRNRNAVKDDDDDDEDTDEESQEERDEEPAGKRKPKVSKARGALQLAVVSDERTLEAHTRRHFFGLRGTLFNVTLLKPPEPADREIGRAMEVLLHLGKWFSGEKAEDNWVRRLLQASLGGASNDLPLLQPGVGFYPVTLTVAGGDDASVNLKQEWRADAISVGLDVTGTTDAGLYQTDPPRFRLGKLEVRALLSLEFLQSSERPLIWGLGVKASGLRISLTPDKQTATDHGDGDSPATEDDDSSKEAGLQDALGMQLVQATSQALALVSSPPAPQPKTRLGRSKRDEKAEREGFAISAGYLSPLGPDGSGVFDVQLYDSAGKRGKVVWMPVDRTVARVFYLKSIGMALRDVEKREAKMTLQVIGGLRFSVFELGLIGAGVSFPLNAPEKLEPVLDGLDLSFVIGPAQIRGSFLKRQGIVYGADGKPLLGPDGKAATITQYGGEVSVKLASFSIMATGAYGQLNEGGPATLFVYGAFSAGSGRGLGNSVLQVTALALGFGVNRRVRIPAIEDVAKFPLVRMVMGEGGLNEDAGGGDLRERLMSKSAEDVEPGEMLQDLMDNLEPQEGQYFGALGLRFTLFENIDCFGLAIVQGGQDLRISLLGLARFRRPETGQALAYVELALLLDIRPSEGNLRLEARLTSNSWVFDRTCQLTGGFALVVWYGGEHPGDFVLSLGGYHPRFVRPSHYPAVDRLRMNWKMSPSLFVKGDLYLAITPSAIMAGARLEAFFASASVKASFLAYVDILVEWKPIHYDITAGIVLSIDLDFSITTVKITVCIDLCIQGPPFHGTAWIQVATVEVPIEFGEQPQKKVTRIQHWPEFGRNFLDRYERDGKRADSSNVQADGKWAVPQIDQPVEGPSFHRIDLVQGRTIRPGMADAGGSGAADAVGAMPASAAQRPMNGAAAMPGAEPQTRGTSASQPTTSPEPGQRDDPWIVRADELELAAATIIPATELRLGMMKIDDAAMVVLSKGNGGGRPLSVADPLELPQNVRLRANGSKLGMRPMGVSDLLSPLTIMLVREEGESGFLALDLEDWHVVAQRGALPSALWDTAPLDREKPSADTVAGCITGVQRLAPPVGGPDDGAKVVHIDAASLDYQISRQEHSLSEKTMSQATVTQSKLVAVEASATDRQRHVAQILEQAGFAEAALFTAEGDGRLRGLRAAPLTRRMRPSDPNTAHAPDNQV